MRLNPSTEKLGYSFLFLIFVCVFYYRFHHWYPTTDFRHLSYKIVPLYLPHDQSRNFVSEK